MWRGEAGDKEPNLPGGQSTDNASDEGVAI